jgi:hypothetical protein
MPASLAVTSERPDEVLRNDHTCDRAADHTPSLRLTRSLTACGLALPPEDFIA